MRKDLEFLKYWPWALFVPHFLFSSDELIYSDYISDVCVCVCVYLQNMYLFSRSLLWSLDQIQSDCMTIWISYGHFKIYMSYTAILIIHN